MKSCPCLKSAQLSAKEIRDRSRTFQNFPDMVETLLVKWTNNNEFKQISEWHFKVTSKGNIGAKRIPAKLKWVVIGLTVDILFKLMKQSNCHITSLFLCKKGGKIWNLLKIHCSLAFVFGPSRISHLDQTHYVIDSLDCYLLVMKSLGLLNKN